MTCNIAESRYGHQKRCSQTLYIVKILKVCWCKISFKYYFIFITLSVYEQCVNDLSDLLSKHAPLLTHTFINESAGWLSDSYERVRIDTQMSV